MHVATGFRATGRWQIWTPTGTAEGEGPMERAIIIHTPDDPDYFTPVHVDLANRKHVDFEVLARNDAHVRLELKNNKMFEIVMGAYDDKRSVLRTEKQGPTIAEGKGSVLSTTCYRPFVLSLKQPGVLQLLYCKEMNAREAVPEEHLQVKRPDVNSSGNASMEGS